MEVQEIIEQARDTITVRRVFGEPIEKNGVVVVPAAAVRGGGGGGGSEDKEGQSGTGGGFGVSARPVGAYVIRGEQVEWQPALDVGRIALAGLAVLGVALWAFRGVRKARAKAAWKAA